MKRYMDIIIKMVKKAWGNYNRAFFDVKLPRSTRWINLYGQYLRIIYKCFSCGVSKDDDFEMNRTMFVGYWQDQCFLVELIFHIKKI